MRIEHIYLGQNEEKETLKSGVLMNATIWWQVERCSRPKSIKSYFTLTAYIDCLWSHAEVAQE